MLEIKRNKLVSEPASVLRVCVCESQCEHVLLNIALQPLSLFSLYLYLWKCSSSTFYCCCIHCGKTDKVFDKKSVALLFHSAIIGDALLRQEKANDWWRRGGERMRCSQMLDFIFNYTQADKLLSLTTSREILHIEVHVLFNAKISITTILWLENTRNKMLINVD